MAGTIHQHLPSCGYAKEAEEQVWEERKALTSGKDLLWKDKCKSKPSPMHSDFKQRVAREPSWMDRKDTTIEELRSPDPCYGKSQVMAATIGSAKEAEEENWKECKTSISGNDFLWKEFFRDHSNLSPRYPDFKHRVTREPMWMDSPGTPSWIIEELSSQGFTGDPGHDTSLVNAFVASLRACTRNKDLVRGTSIHNDVVRRGLLEKCSHALVIMYAKCGELGKAKELLDMHKSSSNVVTWTALIAGYAREGHGQNALHCFEQMQQEGILPDAVTYTCILKACATIGAVDKGIQIHDEIARQGLLQNNIVLGGALVDMYAKCGSISKARQVFNGLSSRNVVSWNALITGYVQEGHAEQALNYYEEMQHDGILPNAVTFVCILKACTMIGAADKGEQIHDELAKQGLLQNNNVLGGALVDMYAKCGAVSKARQVLDGLPFRNCVSWSALIAGYAQEGHAEHALDCFEEMQCEGILPDAVTFICILKACATIRATDKGKQIHEAITRQGLLQNDIVLGNALVDMYAKCGVVSKARQVLDGLPLRNVVSWNALIAGYAQGGHVEQALRCFEEMQHEGILPDAVTCICILKACSMIRAADKGKQIHDEIARQGLLQNDIALSNALVDMYAKCGAVIKARQVLDGLPSRDVVSWSALIAGYAQEGHAEQALNCFEEMQREGILPEAVTFICILKACALIRAADKGKQIHDKIARQGLLQNNFVLGNALVEMYAKCGAVSEAQQVLDGMPSRDVVSWNALISGYVEEGHAEQALNCFEQMQRDAVLPDAATFICILKACAAIGAADKGKQIHEEIAKQGLLQTDIVLGSALVDMYAKCGAISKARQVLNGLPSRDVVSWSALIAGYAQEGHAEQALNCFEEMQHEGILPDAVTFIFILKACATIGAADKGKQIHDEIARQGLLQSNIMLSNAVADMYAKCGAVSKARQVLDGMPSRDVVSWNALIAGYAQEGHAEQAIDCFEEMEHEGILPDVVTCACVLNVCSHQGLVEEGEALFVNMSTKFAVNPSLECYNCMVDLFGRAGHLEKAVRLIQDVSSSGYSIIWDTLLAACWKWADVKVGRWAFEQAVKMDKSNGPAYVLMANIYATAGMGQEAENIEAMGIRNRAWKKPGRSVWINSCIAVHALSGGDTKHALSKCMDVKLEDIADKMPQVY